MHEIDVSVGEPPSHPQQKNHEDEKALLDAAMENRGKWVSVENQEGGKLNPNAYGRLYRESAKKIGVHVKLVGNKKYLLIPRNA